MVEFRRGLKLQLGSSEIERRLSRFIRFYPLLREPVGKRLKSIDLRYTNGLAVEWVTVNLPQTSKHGKPVTGLGTGWLEREGKGQA